MRVESHRAGIWGPTDLVVDTGHIKQKGGFFSGPEPRLFAHRGASALAPENTIESFRLARTAGAPYLELDVHLTADGHVVVIHDNSVSRTTGRRGRVERMSLAEIRRLDPGHEFTLDRGRSFPYRGKGLRIPTLEEVLQEFPEARITVEIKKTKRGIGGAVLDVIRRCHATERVLVASHEHQHLQEFRSLDGDVPTSFSKSEVREFLARVRGGDTNGYRAPGNALQVPEYFGLRRVTSVAFIEAAHRLGVEVHVWTVNEPVHMKRLLRWGVDGIMTDDPARAISSVAELAGVAEAVAPPGSD
jgi:glycerophosphoryl diester phosphodiesterase